MTFILSLLLAFAAPDAIADETHDHDHEGHEHEEASAQVGPGRGVRETGPLGFRLSPEALKTIGFATAPYSPGGDVPCGAIVEVKSEKSIFRSREGWLKRESVTVTRKGAACAIRSGALKPGDVVVTTQTGFLRIAEVFLHEGAAHSHSH